jgi:hypothetical protein
MILIKFIFRCFLFLFQPVVAIGQKFNGWYLAKMPDACVPLVKHVGGWHAFVCESVSCGLQAVWGCSCGGLAGGSMAEAAPPNSCKLRKNWSCIDRSLVASIS